MLIDNWKPCKTRGEAKLFKGPNLIAEAFLTVEMTLDSVLSNDSIHYRR
jgi:hypothetical protein